MKVVFSKTRDVCAVWASQSQEKARNGGNTWCRGPELGSYGTVIARIVTSAAGQPIALVSLNRYSKTTAVVIGEATDEARKSGLAVYVVPRFDAAGHVENLASFDRRIEEKIAGLKKAVRWDSARTWRSEALQLIATANLYARDFDQAWKWRGENPIAVINKHELAWAA